MARPQGVKSPKVTRYYHDKNTLCVPQGFLDESVAHEDVMTRKHVPHHLALNYCDVIMGAMASQITSLTINDSTVHSGADQRKHQSSASLAFFAGNSPVTGEFPAQMASNAENDSI